MKAQHVDWSANESKEGAATETTAEVRRQVLIELEKILTSRYFKSAGRCRQFLSYVVHSKLEGHLEQLKERTIGAELFQRPPGYATGEDPVVRVQAGEVRRRLEQYYQSLSEEPQLVIELPVGSYAPLFHGAEDGARRVSEPQSREETHAHEAHHTHNEKFAIQADDSFRSSKWIRPSYYLMAVLLLIMASALIYLLVARHQSEAQRSLLEQFWAPAFASRQPFLICMAKPVAYRPTEDVYRRYSREHPGTFQSEAERSNVPLPLDPNTTLHWSDLFIYRDFGIASGDVHAAVSLSGLMGKYEHPYQLRIGSGFNFEDLRNSPAAVIGGFNNRWTMQTIANQRFAFVEDHEHYMIHEQIVGGRTWSTRWGSNGEPLEDYAIISRLIDSNTGQFILVVAGITSEGTQTAGEFVSSPHALEEGLSLLPPNWQQRNIEFVLKTAVTDSVAGPPHVEAFYVW